MKSLFETKLFAQLVKATKILICYLPRLHTLQSQYRFSKAKYKRTPSSPSTLWNKYAGKFAPRSMPAFMRRILQTRHRTRGDDSLVHHPIQHLWSTFWGNPRRPNLMSMLRSAVIVLVQCQKWLQSTVLIVNCIFIEDIINLIATSGLAHMWIRTSVIGVKGASMRRTICLRVKNAILIFTPNVMLTTVRALMVGSKRKIWETKEVK